MGSLRGCTPCELDPTCSEDSCFNGFCRESALKSTQSAIDVCKAEPYEESQQNDPVSPPNTDPISPPPSNPASPPADENHSYPIPPPPDCVETEWLKQNGFGAGILRERGISKTLCISGLPCGTEGHLLRECDPVAGCKLVSYKQFCQKRGGCHVKYTAVSLLSAREDWSVVKVPSCSTDGSTLSLRSLSMEPNGGAFEFISYLIAKVGDTFIRAGLGQGLDAFVLAWNDFAKHSKLIVGAMVFGRESISELCV